MDNGSDKRDHLALERTKLANERTLLAYIRTGLSLLAAAALLLHFSPSFTAYIPLAVGSILLGSVITLTGVVRFIKVNKNLFESTS